MVATSSRSGAPSTARRTLALVAVGWALGLGLAGCGDDDAPDAGGAPSPVDESTTTSTGGTGMTDDTTSTSVPGGPDQPLRTGQTEVAVADLAGRLGVGPDAVQVVSTQAVTWRDSSLGCPQRGMMYLQVLTEGVQIILEVDGTRYRYHAGGSADPFYCATPEEPQSVG